jgi:hypothetical protein
MLASEHEKEPRTVPICLPEQPEFSTESERKVWTLLRDQLGPGDLLIANQRVTDRFKDYEVDLAAVMPGAGVVVIEVKGSTIRCKDGHWLQPWDNGLKEIHPVRQVIQAKYASGRTSRATTDGGVVDASAGATPWCFRTRLWTRVSPNLTAHGGRSLAEMTSTAWWRGCVPSGLSRRPATGYPTPTTWPRSPTCCVVGCCHSAT